MSKTPLERLKELDDLEAKRKEDNMELMKDFVFEMTYAFGVHKLMKVLGLEPKSWVKIRLERKIKNKHE